MLLTAAVQDDMSTSRRLDTRIARSGYDVAFRIA